VLEFLTDIHNTFNIIRLLLAFKHHLNANPNRIEVEFSWALIHAELLSLNAMDSICYLQDSYEGTMTNITVIHICCAHLSRTFKRTMKAILKSDKQRSEMQMRVFALLQNTTDTKDVQHLSQHIYNMFGRKNKDA